MQTLQAPFFFSSPSPSLSLSRFSLFLFITLSPSPFHLFSVIPPFFLSLSLSLCLSSLFFSSFIIRDFPVPPALGVLATGINPIESSKFPLFFLFFSFEFSFLFSFSPAFACLLPFPPAPLLFRLYLAVYASHDAVVAALPLESINPRNLHATYRVPLEGGRRGCASTMKRTTIKPRCMYRCMQDSATLTTTCRECRKNTMVATP